MCPIKNNLNVLYLEHNKSLKHATKLPEKCHDKGHIGTSESRSSIDDGNWHQHNWNHENCKCFPIEKNVIFALDKF